jgi:hypothetical protein
MPGLQTIDIKGFGGYDAAEKQSRMLSGLRKSLEVG